jgi:hypothetical protein
MAKVHTGDLPSTATEHTLRAAFAGHGLGQRRGR